MIDLVSFVCASRPRHPCAVTADGRRAASVSSDQVDCVVGMRGSFGAAIGLLYSIPITLLDIVYVSAAVHGFRTAGRCTRAHEAHQRALQSTTEP